MKAAVFHKIGDISVDNVDDPRIEKPDDIILKVTSTAICGSDLHIYDGFVPQLRDEVLGHEFMGIVEEVGPEVTRVKKRRSRSGAIYNCLWTMFLLFARLSPELRSYQSAPLWAGR
ncbi:MAG: alcohol dehydrogenase catalytic domain-containing protein [Chitinophagaceae bacterium]|nr:alcohol dehydrogenase catalytic domain-containing protein [Chitinophagaceae bacterium]